MNKKWIRYIFLNIMMVPNLLFAHAKVHLTHIDIKHHKAATIVIFTLNQSTGTHAFMLRHPNRLVIDFEKTSLTFNLATYRVKDANIQKIRAGSPRSGILRLVFDLKKPVHITKMANTSRGQMQIEIFPPIINMSKSIPIHAIKKITAPKIYHLMTIVIDPGHGGRDPGAQGKYGVKEKDVVLAIAKGLANLINQQNNMRAYLTREGDYFVSLRERLMMARNHKADLFVSIHADSYFNTKAKGASIYALSHHGATSVAARWLANRENHSELNNVTFSELDDQSYLLRSVLIDLAQTVTIRDSLRLAHSLLNALDDVTALHYSKVEQAPFMVLKSPDIPSILVETGFISNISEELRLQNRAYQHKIAVALFHGIRQYHSQYKA